MEIVLNTYRFGDGSENEYVDVYCRDRDGNDRLLGSVTMLVNPDKERAFGRQDIAKDDNGEWEVVDGFVAHTPMTLVLALHEGAVKIGAYESGGRVRTIFENGELINVIYEHAEIMELLFEALETAHHWDAWLPDLVATLGGDQVTDARYHVDGPYKPNGQPRTD